MEPVLHQVFDCFPHRWLYMSYAISPTHYLAIKTNLKHIEYVLYVLSKHFAYINPLILKQAYELSTTLNS